LGCAATAAELASVAIAGDVMMSAAIIAVLAKASAIFM
jgi:hypothetical protein